MCDHEACSHPSDPESRSTGIDNIALDQLNVLGSLDPLKHLDMIISPQELPAKFLERHPSTADMECDGIVLLHFGINPSIPVLL